eukprot:Platyproteum_vivax@DN13364_c0_g1_i1.p1
MGCCVIRDKPPLSGVGVTSDIHGETPSQEGSQVFDSVGFAAQAQQQEQDVNNNQEANKKTATSPQPEETSKEDKGPQVEATTSVGGGVAADGTPAATTP